MPPVSSPISLKLPTPNRIFRVSPVVLLIALAAIVLTASASSLVYFAHLPHPQNPNRTTPVVHITVTPSHLLTPTSTATLSPTATPSPVGPPTSIAFVPASALITPDTLTVGVSDSGYDSPPETYYPSGSSSPAGFDIDLIRAMAQAMNLNVNIKEIPINGLVTSLKNKQIDVVDEAYSLTDKIKNETLSVPYLNPKDVLLVSSGNPNHISFNALTDLCGHTVGVEADTSEKDTLAAVKCPQGQINVVVLPKADDVANALIQHQQNIEAIYQSSPTVSYYQHQFPGKFQQVGTTLPVPEEGILIRQDNYNLLTASQSAFSSLVQDGTYKRLLNTSMGDLTGDSIVS